MQCISVRLTPAVTQLTLLDNVAECDCYFSSLISGKRDALTLFIHIVKTVAPFHRFRRRCVPQARSGAPEFAERGVFDLGQLIFPRFYCVALCLLKLQEAPLLNWRAAKPPQFNPNMLKSDLFQIPLFGVRGKIWQQAEHYFLKAHFIMFFFPAAVPPGVHLFHWMECSRSVSVLWVLGDKNRR